MFVKAEALLWSLKPKFILPYITRYFGTKNILVTHTSDAFRSIPDICVRKKINDKNLKPSVSYVV